MKETIDMQDKTTKCFKSCFICEVNIDDTTIELVDSSHQPFCIKKDRQELMLEFKDWFVNIFKACIPQTLTVVQYHVEQSDDGPVSVVDKLVYKKQAVSSMLNESKA